jgi:hypothetical protein
MAALGPNLTQSGCRCDRLGGTFIVLTNMDIIISIKPGNLSMKRFSDLKARLSPGDGAHRVVTVHRRLCGRPEAWK